jgi:uncharacterized membrane protein YidH (DUF202 family)
MGTTGKTDIRAALIVAFLAAAAGFGRWVMDGPKSDAAHLLAAVRHPLKSSDSIAAVILAAGTIAAIYGVWWLFSMRRRVKKEGRA